MQPNTRNRIIETGAEIIHRKGFNHTGIQEILNAAGVPKGSFYNYFKSKDDFGLQIIDYFSAHFKRIAKETLEDTTVSPLNRIYGFFLGFKLLIIFRPTLSALPKKRWKTPRFHRSTEYTGF
jgi:TetR/AcrR family transcriptional repressor of nem operon